MTTTSCLHCDTEFNADLSHCPACNHFVSYPNVRDVSVQAEKDALQQRYDAACAEHNRADNEKTFTDFEQATLESIAVINVNGAFLEMFFSREEHLYSTYHLAIDGEIRNPASPADDRRRCAVDGALFGSYGKEIRFAAISLNGAGLSSYGPYTMRIKNKAIAHRATLLEENSFLFLEKQAMKVTDKLPCGYRAVWDDRHKLAVSKHAERLAKTTSNDDFAGIMLTNSGNRADDDFMEVHIYGPFNRSAIESVSGPLPRSKYDKVTFKVLVNLIRRAKCEFYEG